MSDLLRMDYINSLPQPLFAGSGGTFWPVHDIDVETGLYRIDVIGLLQVMHFGGVTQIRDAEGGLHAPDTFYTDYEETQ